MRLSIAVYHGMSENKLIPSKHIQAGDRGAPTWILLPEELWPNGWKGKYLFPVKLDKARYGHPASGGYWEDHCNNALLSVWLTTASDRPVALFHNTPKLLQSISVDDFKMAAPRKR